MKKLAMIIITLFMLISCSAKKKTQSTFPKNFDEAELWFDDLHNREIQKN